MAAPSIVGSSYGGVSYTTSSMPLAPPTGAAAGMLLALGISWRTINGTPTTHTPLVPSGWTQQVNDQTANGNDDKGLLICTRVMESGDTNWTATFTGSGATRAWRMVAVSGADGATPVAQAVTQKSTANTTSHTNPTMTTGANDALRLDFWTDHLTDDGTLPGSMTHIGSHRKGGVSGVVFEAKVGAAYEVVASAGATGTRTFTESSGDDYVGGALEISAGATALTMTGATGGTIRLTSGVPLLRAASTSTAVEQALDKELTDGLVVLHDLEPFDLDAGGVGAEFVSTDGYSTSTEQYDPVVVSELQLDEALFEDDVLGGVASSSVGALRLRNERTSEGSLAGRLDDWVRRKFWDDRKDTIRVTTRTLGGAYGDKSVALLVKTARTTSRRSSTGGKGERYLDFGLADLLHRLGRKVQLERFAGDGTAYEGDAQIAGRECPLVLGQKKRITPVLTDRANKVYVFHRDAVGGQCRSVDRVEVGANLLAAEDYTVDLTTNSITLNTGVDDSKAMTVDVTGPSAAGDTVADHLIYLLSDSYLGPLPHASVASPAMEVYRAQYGGQSYFELREGETLLDAVNRLIRPGGYLREAADGTLAVGLLTDPATAFVDRVHNGKLYSVEQEEIAPPFRSLVVGYDANGTPVSEDGVAAAALLTDRGQYAQQPYLRLAPIEDVGQLDRWPSAPTAGEYVLPLVEASDALEEQERLWQLYSVPAEVVTIVVGAVGLIYQVGEVIRVTTPLWSLDAGVAFRILSRSIRGAGNRIRVTLKLWRPYPQDLLVTEGGDFLVTEDGDELAA